MSRVTNDDIHPVSAFRGNIVTGGVVGAGAYLTNYALTYLFVIVDGADSAGGMATWKAVGQTLYNAHLVPTSFSAPGYSATANFVTKSHSDDRLLSTVYGTPIGDTVPALVYHLAPVVVLAVAGLLAARTVQASLETEGAVAAGLAIVPGTLALSVVGVFLFAASPGGGSTSLSPDIVLGVLLVGILIPAVGGAIGGAVSEYV